MDKNSTPSSSILDSSAPSVQGPSRFTIEKIRQFARAYTFVPVEIPALGGIIAN